MKLCRDCRRVWSSDALFCGRCKRSFGGRRCEAKHLSPATALFCTTCGSRKLSQAAHYIGLSVPVSITAGITGLLFLKLVFANLWSILGFALSSLGAIAAFVIGDSAGHLFGALLHFAAVLTLAWIGFRRILGFDSRVVRGIERLAWNLLVTTGRASFKLARAFLAWIIPRSARGSNGDQS